MTNKLGLPPKHIPRQIITDVDGVLTTGQFLYDQQGKAYKIFGPNDSDGVKILKKLGFLIQAVTADFRGYNISQKRCHDMGIDCGYIPEGERLDWIEREFEFAHTIYIGDGIHCASVLARCAFGFAPGNAVPAAKQNANWVLDAHGGEGVLLEVALWIARHWFQKEWQDLI